MSESPESVVRRFLAAWADPQTDQLGGFFHEQAEWVDGPQGVRRGAKEIHNELESQLRAVGGVTVEIRTVLSADRTVMVEQVSNSTVNGKPISSVVMAVFEFDADGRILQWREAYDLKSTLDQMQAASG